MTAEVAPRTRSVPGSGWSVVAAKEFGDHLLSARFLVLVVVLGLAAAIPLYFAAAAIRSVASGVTDAQAIFIALFWLAPDVGGQFTLPSVAGFLAYVAPLLGLAFAFDAINGERAEGTLPRLLSQPIHRDDVVNGKFVAGLAVIGLVLVTVVGVIAAFGIIRLGIVPKPSEILRIVLWVLLTFVYVSLWLAFGMLLSVAVRRAATSALIGFGAWLLLTFFGGLIVSLIGGVIAPVAGSAEEVLRNNGDPGEPPPPAAGHPLPGGVAHAAESAGDLGVDAGHDRELCPGAGADPIAALTRPELHPGLAAGGRTRGDDRRVLRARLRPVHAPGGPRLGPATPVVRRSTASLDAPLNSEWERPMFEPAVVGVALLLSIPAGVLFTLFAGINRIPWRYALEIGVGGRRSWPSRTSRRSPPARRSKLVSSS